MKVKRGIRICIKVMRIRNSGCSQRRYLGKSLLAAKRKAAQSLVEFSCGSATLDAPSAYWLLSEKPHSHWLNWHAGPQHCMYTSSVDV
jgi:hypothetical protein